MWVPQSPKWSDVRPLTEAVKNGKLTVCIGNGLSRLSNMPSWNELLFEPVVEEDIRAQGIYLRNEIKRGTSILELLDCLSNTAKKHLCGFLCDREDTAQINLVHRILFGVLRPGSVFTFNYDQLLERTIAALRDKNALLPTWPPLPALKPVHLHGSLTTPSQSYINTDIALGETSYQISEEGVREKYKQMLLPGAVILFLGYSHSYEDYDVHRTLSRLAREGHGAYLYSLISSLERNAVQDARLERCQIKPIYYSLPENAVPASRILALSQALYDLAVQSSGSDHVEKLMWPEWQQELNSLRKQEDDANRESTLVIGLSAMHRIAEPRPREHSIATNYNPYPDGSRKNVGTNETEEPGGPGLIVAKVLSALGKRASLVSSVADDPYGEMVQQALKHNPPGFEPIDLDHFTIQSSWSDDFSPTWSSYVLLNPKPYGHRTFLDRYIDPRNRPKAGPKVDAAAELMRDNPPRFVYFDKFYSEAVRKLLQHPGGAGLSDRVITFYETGSDGDKTNGYAFETDVARGTVNVALCSFRFARDFLGNNQSSSTDTYKRDFYVDEILADERESELIETLLVKNSQSQKVFVDAIRDGAKRWLRVKGPRLVVVTLHHFGAIWILVDSDQHALVPTIPSTKHFGFSAGDVFRAGFVAGAVEMDKGTPDFLSDPVTLTRVTKLANRLARIKVESRSFISCLPEFQKSFREWRDS